jgi:hypothetical protein
MRVAPPAGGVKVNFNVAAEQGSTNLETGTREIRTSLDVPAARRQDADGATVASLQVVRVENLVGPDGLNETLGDWDGLVEVRRLAEGEGKGHARPAEGGVIAGRNDPLHGKNLR